MKTAKQNIQQHSSNNSITASLKLPESITIPDPIYTIMQGYLKYVLELAG